MFTGIIEEIGIIARVIKEKSRPLLLEIASKKIKPKLGDSISVNGACLTVSKIKKNGFGVEVVNETLSKTNLGFLKKGAKVNLEPSLKIGSRLGGHFVTGHIDTATRVIKREKNKNGAYLILKLTKTIKPFVVEKGSIAINGISLTVAAVKTNYFSVALIPFTEENTNLSFLRTNDSANIEVDLIARYLRNFVI